MEISSSSPTPIGSSASICRFCGFPLRKFGAFGSITPRVCILEPEERGFRVLGFNHGPDLTHALRAKDFILKMAKKD